MQSLQTIIRQNAEHSVREAVGAALTERLIQVLRDTADSIENGTATDSLPEQLRALAGAAETSLQAGSH